jgi:hypothetical protein
MMRIVFFLRRRVEKESWEVIKLTAGNQKPRELVSLARVTLLTNCLAIKKDKKLQEMKLSWLSG